MIAQMAMEAALRDLLKKKEAENKRLMAALQSAPRPTVGSKWDTVAYLDWFFKERGPAMLHSPTADD